LLSPRRISCHVYSGRPRVCPSPHPPRPWWTGPRGEAGRESAGGRRGTRLEIQPPANSVRQRTPRGLREPGFRDAGETACSACTPRCFSSLCAPRSDSWRVFGPYRHATPALPQRDEHEAESTGSWALSLSARAGPLTDRRYYTSSPVRAEEPAECRLDIPMLAAGPWGKRGHFPRRALRATVPAVSPLPPRYLPRSPPEPAPET